VFACGQDNFAETMREVSALWRGLSEEEKDQYRQAAARQSQPSKRAAGEHKTTKAGGTRQRSRTTVSLSSNVTVMAPT